MPPMPALGRARIERLELGVGGDHRAAHQPEQVRAVRQHDVELVEIGFTASTDFMSRPVRNSAVA